MNQNIIQLNYLPMSRLELSKPKIEKKKANYFYNNKYTLIHPKNQVIVRNNSDFSSIQQLPNQTSTNLNTEKPLTNMLINKNSNFSRDASCEISSQFCRKVSNPKNLSSQISQYAPFSNKEKIDVPYNINKTIYKNKVDTNIFYFDSKRNPIKQNNSHSVDVSNVTHNFLQKYRTSKDRTEDCSTLPSLLEQNKISFTPYMTMTQSSLCQQDMTKNKPILEIKQQGIQESDTNRKEEQIIKLNHNIMLQYNERKNLIKKVQSEVQIQAQIKKIQRNTLNRNNIIQDNFLTASKVKYKTLLILRDEAFDIALSKNSLCYCYHQIPFAQYYEREKVIQKDYNDLLEKIKFKLKLQSDNVYVYLKNGQIIALHVEIPDSATTLIVSTSPCFKGIQYIKKNSERFQRILQQLEAPLINSAKDDNQSNNFSNNRFESYNILMNKRMSVNYNSQNIKNKTTFEKQISKKFKPVINSIIKCLNKQRVRIESASDDEMSQYDIKDYNDQFCLDSHALERINKCKLDQDVLRLIDQEKQKQKKLKLHLSSQIKFENNEDYLNNEEILIKTQKIKNLQNINDYYEQDIKKTKFEGVEANEETNEIVDRILNRNKYDCIEEEIHPIKAIAESVGFFSKTQAKLLSQTQLPRESRFDLQQAKLLQKYKDNPIKNNPAKRRKSLIYRQQKKLFTARKNKYENKNKKEEIHKYKVQQIISEYMQEFLKEMNAKKKIYLQRENDQKILQSSDSEAEQVRDINYDELNVSIDSMKDKKTDEDQENSKQNINKFEINFEEEKEEKNIEFHIKKNIDKIKTNKQTIREINKKNKELYSLNIPKILIDIPQLVQDNNQNQSLEIINENEKMLSNFSRYDIHQIYSIYKTLHQVTSQRYKKDYEIDKGLDYDVYRNGLYSVFMQSEQLAQSIFNKIDYNYSGFMDWKEFLKLMVIIRAKTLAEKINLFIKIADVNGDGKLDWGEISEIAKVVLERYLPHDSDNDIEFLDKLCNYFTKLIFQTVQIPFIVNDENTTPDGEIPFDNMKQTIINGKNIDTDLLCMFCGADI